MKRFLKVGFVILGSSILLGIIWFAAIPYLFTGTHPYKIEPVYSIDKSMVAIPTVSYDKNNHETYLLVYIEIQDTKSGETLFQVLTRASNRMRWSVSWVGNNTVRLDSSDIGFYCWTDRAGKWNEIKCP